MANVLSYIVCKLWTQFYYFSKWQNYYSLGYFGIQPHENQSEVEECDKLFLTSGYLCVSKCVNQLFCHALERVRKQLE